MKKYLIFILTVLVLLFIIAYQRDVNTSLRGENARKDKNIETLNQKAQTYTTKSGKSAIKAQALTYTKKELKKYEPELVRTAKASGIRTNDIATVAELTTTTTAKVLPVVHDTINKTDTLKCLEFSDPYLKLSGCIGDSMKVEVFDTLTYIAEKVRKRFLFIRYGVKGINLHVVSKNPYTRLNSAKYIELK